MNIKNIVKNVTPAATVMVVGIVGAFLVYNIYFSDKIAATTASSFEPAAGEEHVMGEDHDMTAEDHGMAMEGDSAAAATEEPKCMMDAEGNPVMGEDGKCVPEPKCMMDETGNPMMGEDGKCVPAPAEAEEAAPAEEGTHMEMEDTAPAAQ